MVGGKVTPEILRQPRLQCWIVGHESFFFTERNKKITWNEISAVWRWGNIYPQHCQIVVVLAKYNA